MVGLLKYSELRISSKLKSKKEYTRYHTSNKHANEKRLRKDNTRRKRVRTKKTEKSTPYSSIRYRNDSSSVLQQTARSCDGGITAVYKNAPPPQISSRWFAGGAAVYSSGVRRSSSSSVANYDTAETKRKVI